MITEIMNFHTFTMQTNIHKLVQSAEFSAQINAIYTDIENKFKYNHLILLNVIYIDIFINFLIQHF